MKKMIALFLMGMCVFTLVGCNAGEKQQDAIGAHHTELDEGMVNSEEIIEENGTTEDTEGLAGLQTLEVNEWGLTLYAEDVTPTGLTIVCTQSGGSPSGELNTGSYYVLEKAEAGTWVAVDYAHPELEVGWTAEAWIIPMSDTVEWEADWEWLYGSLPAGHYRIGKEVMDFRAAGDYDKAYYYAEFEIEE